MFREREPSRLWLYRVPAFKQLYGDPRFQALVRQMDLPEVRAEEVR